MTHSDASYHSAAVLLVASGLALGIAAPLPTAPPSAAQILARRASAGGSRRLLARAWTAQAVGYASLGLCLLAPHPWSVAVLIGLAFLAWGCGGLVVPAWTALVSSLVPRAHPAWFAGLRGAAP